jgi:circadian clock protein KaiB
MSQGETQRRAGPARSRPRKPSGPKYLLRLYVTGMTPRSRRAIDNIKSICEEYLEGRYDLEVIDIFQRPYLAKDEQIIAAPTLIRKLPMPLRRFIGDLSDRPRVLLGLDLRPH